MGFAIALAVFAAAFVVTAIVSERLTPLVGIGGLLALLALAAMVG